MKTDKKIGLNELKKDLIAGIRRFESSATREIGKKWIQEVEGSGSIKEVLTGEKAKD